MRISTVGAADREEFGGGFPEPGLTEGDGQTLYVIVDSRPGAETSFTITTTCN